MIINGLFYDRCLDEAPPSAFGTVRGGGKADHGSYNIDTCPKGLQSYIVKGQMS